MDKGDQRNTKEGPKEDQRNTLSHVAIKTKKTSKIANLMTRLTETSLFSNLITGINPMLSQTKLKNYQKSLTVLWLPNLMWQ